eukprot:272348-Pleurochrysis_carterae.AAC.1
MKAQQTEKSAGDDARPATPAAHGSVKTQAEPVIGQPMEPTVRADADLNAPSPPPTTPRHDKPRRPAARALELDEPAPLQRARPVLGGWPLVSLLINVAFVTLAVVLGVQHVLNANGAASWPCDSYACVVRRIARAQLACQLMSTLLLCTEYGAALLASALAIAVPCFLMRPCVNVARRLVVRRSRVRPVRAPAQDEFLAR